MPALRASIARSFRAVPQFIQWIGQPWSLAPAAPPLGRRRFDGSHPLDKT
jgi:hypothetical protein